ncbi:AfsR/SARP family transcriptional regulator [Pseudoxanthomonas jiangsuensis]|uniref:AfsR/SARP family transcriptional regulator n=1 Tax=Pseudoxanthomonas jiangsuensis TaxID=619688 RepID=UPI00139193CD|nr:BTAD domain-containing putative transcriptional regulator [Pseudoxanthomonas jiangsuensis]
MQRSILAHATAAPVPPIRLLGARRLGAGTREATLQYRKGWALLAYLAVERQRHPRARLAAMFWPELGETAALTNLRQVLSDLNRAMGIAVGEGVLLIDRESVRLCPVASTGLFDVDLLDAGAGANAGGGPGDAQGWLADAGELLEGLSLDACAAFSDWLACTREWAARRVAAGMAQLRDAATARGERRLALVLARRLVAQDPWNELHQRALMRLHAQAGEPGMALAAYQQLVHRLKADLGEAPSRETAELAESIRTAGRRQAVASWRGGMERMAARPVLALGM